ncbi:alpha/beta hydrolase [Streptomyces anulatus]|uniref:alpha/beta hydrolase n=1 Tax=Streptomyces anulatus TaxID=1892 RepID=UPI001D18088B|nr:alpha/beta hydrolase [Streptomyces anulatus]
MEMSNPITNAYEKPSGKPGRRPRAGGLAFSVVLALSVSAVSVVPAAVATTGAPHRGAVAAAAAPTIRWGACPPNDPMPAPGPRVRCGTIEVPVDWSKPQGPRTSVFVARYRGADPAKRIGVLMTNPGGPGSPGADSAMYADRDFSPYLLKRFDVISFDPRGIGRSEGVHCDEAIAAKIPHRPRDAAEFERLRALNGKLAKSCLRQAGPLADHMDTESVARDMDAIRAAAGERRISFMGISYGTSIGERYARLFPQRLRALALDSAVDPAGPSAERYLTDGSVAVDDLFERLVAVCEKDTSCVLKGRKLISVTEELFARADTGTLREPGPNGPTRRKVGADRLVAFLYSALSRYSPAQVTEQLSALHSGRGDVYLDDSGPELAWRLVLCRDNDFRIRDYNAYRAIRKRVAKAAPHVRYNSQALDMVLGCQGWTPPKRPSERAKGALPPVLVVNALHDVATPLAGARRMANAFPGASLLTVDTVGHGMYGLKEPKRAIDAHLSSRRN